ncbi:hypothetical protein HN937_23460, partial [Candidatus Poribacteria bacterium]|nr:hypothetical protein [Candidatus Poribacteria bacterium]
ALRARIGAPLLALILLGLPLRAGAQADPWQPADPPLPFVSITPIGFRLFRDEFLRLVAPLPGRPYDPVLLGKVLDATLKLYHDAGYRFARIREPAITEFEDGYYIRIEIDEGRVGDITVTGLRRTRPEVIEQQLMLVPGRLYVEEDRVESERILRARPYVGDVTVTATPNPKTGEIDILVDVRDLWSLVPRARLVRSSGETTLDDVLNGDVGFQVSLEDSNLSGTGQDWSFRVRREQPDVAHEEGDETPFRTRTAIRMFEPNVFQSRWQMLALYEQQARPDVDAWELSLLHPLYSLRSRWSFRFTALERGGVSEFQRDGVLLREWERRVKRQFASTTFVSGEAERQVQYTLWVSHEADAYDLTYSGPDLTIVDDPAFFSTRNTERRFSVSPSAAPLQTAALAGASVTWQRLRFTEARNIDRLGRVEDIPLGGALTLSVGGGARALANDHDELRPTASYRYSQMLGTHGLFEMKTTARVPYVIRNGRDGTRGMQDVVLTGSARMFIRGGDSRALVWRAHAASLGRTTRDLNLLLDKRNGVRGYPSRSFDGRRRVGLNAEARQVVWTNSYLVTQAAAFGDIGYVWWDPFDVADPKRAVGVGLRLGLQRLAAPAVRADMAYLLDTDPPEWKWSFGTGQYF